MTQRIVEQRSTTMGLGAADFPDGEGLEVTDDELIPPNEAEPAPKPATSARFSNPRITQRLPRISLTEAAVSAGDGELLLGHYRVERIIARTSHEIAVEASHVHLGQRVILRYLTALASSSPEAVARFQRGARRVREMQSEHAERVVDFGRLESGAPYRAVDLPRGPSLSEVQRVRGQIPVAEAVDIVLAACEPVAEAHASGIVHRCLSTHNVFTERRSDGSELVRVLDFGVTDPLEPDWAHGDDLPVPGANQSVETMRYVSPEQIRNPTAVDARADVWSLGVILYELLAGAALYQAEGALTLLAMIAADPPPPLGLSRSDVPPELEQVVQSCLEKDPSARPRSVVELAHALAPFGSSDAEPAAARVARIVTRTTRPPPLPTSQGPVASHGPASSYGPGSRTSRAGVLVQSRTPASLAAPARSDARDLGFLVAGASIGLATALAAMFVVKSPALTQSAAAASLPVPVVAVQPAAAPTVAPSAAASGPVAALSPPAAPVATSASRPRATTPRAERATRAERAPAAEAAKAPVAAQPAAKPKPEPSERKTASADELFGSVD